MRVDPTAGTGGEVMSDAGTIIGVHFPGRRLRLFTFCDDQRSECLAGRRKTPAWARFFAALRSRSHSAVYDGSLPRRRARMGCRSVAGTAQHRFVRQELLSWVSGSAVRQCVERVWHTLKNNGDRWAGFERAHLDRQGVATRGLPRGELRRRVRDRGADSAAAMPPAAAASGLLLAAMAKNSSRHTPRAYALSRREAHAPRRGGRMRNDAARDAFRGPEIKLLMPCVT